MTLKNNYSYYQTPQFSEKGNSNPKYIPNIIGFIIADKEGRKILDVEIFNGAIEHYLRENLDPSQSSKPLDIDLLPMFMSALEKFSGEFNMDNFSKLILKGHCLKMEAICFERYTVSIFTNPHFDISSIRFRLIEFLEEWFSSYCDAFETPFCKASFEILHSLKSHGISLLERLNNA